MTEKNIAATTTNIIKHIMLDVTFLSCLAYFFSTIAEIL